MELLLNARRNNDLRLSLNGLRLSERRQNNTNTMANRKFGWHSGAVHCKSITVGLPAPLKTAVYGDTVTFTGVMTSSKDAVAENIVLNTAGSSGNWAAALYAQVKQGTTKNVTGYLTAAEFEVTLGAVTNVSEWAVMTLNSSDSNTSGSVRSYIWLRDYGSLAMNALFRFSDQSIATTTKTVLLSTSGDLTSSHTIRILIGSTPYWILLNATGP